jgi:hypothetical protein
MHRLPLQHPVIEAHLHEARPEDLIHIPVPSDGCAALRLIEIATYELHVRPAGDLTLEGTLGEKPLGFRRIDQTWICTFSADNFVGPTELRLRLDGKVLLDLPLEVRSSKLDYLRDGRRAQFLGREPSQLSVLSLSPPGCQVGPGQLFTAQEVRRSRRVAGHQSPTRPSV